MSQLNGADPLAPQSDQASQLRDFTKGWLGMGADPEHLTQKAANNYKLPEDQQKLNVWKKPDGGYFSMAGDEQVRKHAREHADQYGEHLKNYFPQLGDDAISNAKEKMYDKTFAQTRGFLLQNKAQEILQDGDSSITANKYLRWIPWARMGMHIGKSWDAYSAGKNFENGEATPGDYITAARQMAEKHQASQQGLGGSLTDIAAELGPMAVEWATLGGPSGAASKAVVARLGTGLLSKAGGVAAYGAVQTAGQAAGRVPAGALQRAAPGVFIDPQGGLQTTEGKPLGEAALKELASEWISNTAFSVANPLMRQSGQKLLTRLAMGTGFGLATVEGDAELQHALRLQPEGSDFRKLVSKDPEERKTAAQRIAGQMIAFGALHGAHEIPNLWKAGSEAATVAEQNGLPHEHKKLAESLKEHLDATAQAPEANGVPQPPEAAQAPGAQGPTARNGQVTAPPGGPALPEQAQEAQAAQGEGAQPQIQGAEAAQPGVQAESANGAAPAPDNRPLPAETRPTAPSAGEPTVPATPQPAAGEPGVLKKNGMVQGPREHLREPDAAAARSTDLWRDLYLDKSGSFKTPEEAQQAYQQYQDALKAEGIETKQAKNREVIHQDIVKNLTPKPTNGMRPKASTKLTPEEDAAVKTELDAIKHQPNFFSKYADNIQSQQGLPGIEKGGAAPEPKPFVEAPGQQQLPLETPVNQIKQAKEQLPPSILSLVKKSGGISEKTAKNLGWDIDALKEVIPTIFRDNKLRSGRRDPSELVDELVRQGHLPPYNDATTHGHDHLRQALQDHLRSMEGNLDRIHEKAFEDFHREQQRLVDEGAPSEALQEVTGPSLQAGAAHGGSEPVEETHQQLSAEDAAERAAISGEHGTIPGEFNPAELERKPTNGLRRPASQVAEEKRIAPQPRSVDPLMASYQRELEQLRQQSQAGPEGGVNPDIEEASRQRRIQSLQDKILQAFKDSPEFQAMSKAERKKALENFRYNPGTEGREGVERTRILGIQHEANKGFGRPLSRRERSAFPGGGEPVPREDAASEFPKKVTALANAKVDQERQTNGLPALMTAARMANAEVWDRAMDKLDRDPQAGARLVDELSAKPRTTTVEENAMLLQRKIALANEHRRVAAEYVEGFRGNASMEQMNVLEAREKDLFSQIDKLDKVARSTGTEWGRAGQFRKQLAAEDYSLTGMMQKATVAKGKDLTPEEKVKINELQQRIAALQDQLDAALAAKGRATNGQIPAQKETVAVRRAQGEFDQMVRGLKEQNLPPWRQAANLFVKIERAMKLTSPVTFGKIAATGAEQSVFGPVREVAGSIGRKLPIMSKIMSSAPGEGMGFSPAREKAAQAALWTEGFKDAWAKLKTGKTDLEVLAGTGSDELTGEPGSKVDTILDMPGRTHGAEKAPIMRAAYTRSKLSRIEHNAEKGIPQTPNQDLLDTKEAVKDGFREIFMEDNKVTEMWSAALKKGGPVAETIGRMLVPFTRIPTNIVKQTFEYLLGMPISGSRAVTHYLQGFENLTPEKADSIARQFKRGSVGAGFFLWGMLQPGTFGGLYQRDEREKEDVKWGQMKTPVGNLPAWTQHHPALIVAQIGATVRRNMDHVNKKTGAKADAVDAVAASLMDEAGEVPFVREAKDVLGLADAKERGWQFGNMAKSFTVPAFLDWLARATDTKGGETIKRKPGTVWEHIETGIPGMRQKVPEKTERTNGLNRRRTVP